MFVVMVRSASSISIPNVKLIMTTERFSEETLWIPSTPSTPKMAFSIGSVTSRTTASGLADG